MVVAPGNDSENRPEKGYVRASKPVNGLVRVADGGNGIAVADKRRKQLVLNLVDVLVFVDKDTPVPLLKAGANCGMRGQQANREQEQIVEIEQAGSAKLLTYISNSGFSHSQPASLLSKPLQAFCCVAKQKLPAKPVLPGPSVVVRRDAEI